MSMLAKEIVDKIRYKKDLHEFLYFEADIYLPPVKTITREFLTALVTSKKK